MPQQRFRWDASELLGALKRSVKRTSARSLAEFDICHAFHIYFVSWPKDWLTFCFGAMDRPQFEQIAMRTIAS